jgi:glycosyltransferase involved in cell wall biosynthesis
MVRTSIIIPTYNEARYISHTLKSIKEQKFKDIEVILADSMSDDGTLEIARRVYPKVKVCGSRAKGVPPAYNKAARMAKGDLLLFIDADTSISKTLLSAYDVAFETGDIVAATGPIRPLEQATWGTRMGFKIVSVYLVRLLMALGRPSIIGSNFMTTRKAYAKVGGTDESLLTYYDWDLAHRLGKIGKVAYVKDAVAYTSIRRVKKWGAFKYFTWHASNTLLYHLTHKARTDYEIIR